MDITTNYTSWDVLTKGLNLLTGSNYSGLGVHPLHKGLSLNGRLPFSISEYEFNYMKNFIIRHDLKNGFELATGIAISTLCLGAASQLIGGVLCSLDSYEEELVQKQPIGRTQEILNEDPPGLRVNKLLLNAYGLHRTKLFKGQSPHDSIRILETEFNDKKIDYVFLDCPKDRNDFMRDVSFLPRFLNNKFAIFVHDTHCYPNDFVELSVRFFDIKPRFISHFVFGDTEFSQHFPLGLISNIDFSDPT
jgi:hypothetical protein